MEGISGPYSGSLLIFLQFFGWVVSKKRSVERPPCFKQNLENGIRAVEDADEVVISVSDLFLSLIP